MRVHLATIDPDSRAREVFTELAAASDSSHQVDADPEAADAILFVDLHEQHDPLLAGLRRHELVRRYRSKVFVYDQRDRPMFTLPGIYVSGSPLWARRYRLMVGGPYAENLSTHPWANVEPDLLFSFVGSMTHPVRDAVMRLTHERAVLCDTGDRTYFDMGEHERREARRALAAIGARSKFVLCPRGNGPSSYRLFETLRSGRVPVVFSDEWLAPPRIDWDRCIIRLAEADVAQAPSLLQDIEPQWGDLVAAGRHVVAEELGPESLWKHYARSLDALAAARGRRVRPWWVQRRVIRTWLT